MCKNYSCSIIYKSKHWKQPKNLSTVDCTKCGVCVCTITMAVCSNTDKSHRHNSDSKRPDTKKYILSDPIYIMLKKKTNSPLALDINILTTFERRKGYLLEESMKEDSRI